MKNPEKKKKKIRLVSEESINDMSGEVPLYRSYGVKKRINPFVAILNIILTKTLLVLVVGFQLIIVLINAIFFYMYGGPLLSTVVTLPVAIFLLHINTRVPRRRMDFLRRLKKMCKRNRYRIEFKNGFWKSLRLVGDQDVDFILRAEGEVYFVKYVTPKKPLTSIIFLSKNQLKYTKHARRNIFTLVFSLKDKTKTYSFEFPKYTESEPKAIKAMLVNPMPRDIFVKNCDGTTVPTGTGEKMHGYTIYTGKGLLRELKQKREELHNKTVNH